MVMVIGMLLIKGLLVQGGLYVDFNERSFRDRLAIYRG